MDRYVQSILFCSLISGILETILPAESTKRHLRFLLSCIMILLLLSPMIRAFSSLSGLEAELHEFLQAIESAETSGEEAGKELVSNYSEDVISKYVVDKLQEEFAVSEEEIEVLFETRDGTMIVHVVLRGRASWLDGTKVTTFLKDELNCQVKITRK